MAVEDKIQVKKSSVYLLGVVLLIAVAGYFMLNSGVSGNDNSSNNNGNNDNNGDYAVTIENGIQKVIIGMKDYNYYPNTIRVKAGVPVSISLDKTVYGCFRDFTIRDFEIHKYLKTTQDTIEFTPTEKGTYTFACSMGMGTGTLIVE